MVWRTKSHTFTNELCYKIARVYRLAVFSNCDKGPEAQSKAVLSIVYHETDHNKTAEDQKQYYHRFCGDHCDYVKWCKYDKTGLPYKKTSSTDHSGKKISWSAGVFAGMDTLFPEAYEELVAHFKKLGHQDRMKRCSKNRTTNMNESMHNNFHYIVNKHKKHRFNRYHFAAQHTMLVKNFGHFKSSLCNVFGTMSEQMAHDLQQKDKDTARASSLIHTRNPTSNMSGRKKIRASSLDKSKSAARDRTSGCYTYGNSDSPLRKSTLRKR